MSAGFDYSVPQAYAPNPYSSTYGGSTFDFARPSPPATAPPHTANADDVTASFGKGDLIDLRPAPAGMNYSAHGGGAATTDFFTSPPPPPANVVTPPAVPRHITTRVGSDNVSVFSSPPTPPVARAPAPSPAVHMYAASHPFTPELVQSQQEIQEQIGTEVSESQIEIMAQICRRNIQEQEDRLLAERLANESGSGNTNNYGRSSMVVPRTHHHHHHHHSSSRRNSAPATNSAMVPFHEQKIAIPPVGTIDNPAAVAPKRAKLKQQRPLKTAVGAVGGAVVGGLVMAPVAPLGVVLGGVAGGVATNKALKSKERKVQQRYDQGNFQMQAEFNSPLAQKMQQGDGNDEEEVGFV